MVEPEENSIHVYKQNFSIGKVTHLLEQKRLHPNKNVSAQTSIICV